MAATITLPSGGHGGKTSSAPLIAIRLAFTGDATYPTGGYDFDPAAQLQALGGYDKPPEILAVIAPPKSGHLFEFDRATNKLLYRLATTGLEVASLVNVSVTPGLVEVLVLAR